MVFDQHELDDSLLTNKSDLSVLTLNGHQEDIESGKSNIIFSLKSAKNRVWKSLLRKELEKFGYLDNHDHKTNSNSGKMDLLEKKISGQYEFIKRFLDEELSNKFYTHIILYITNLIALEKYKLQFRMLEKNERKGEEGRDLKRKKRETYDEAESRLISVCHYYALIVQKYKWPYDAAKEQFFYESVYYFAGQMINARFENKQIQNIIMEEIQRIFRTPTFRQTTESRNNFGKFVSAKDLVKAKEHNVPLRDRRLKKYISPLKNGKVRSPVLQRRFPNPDPKIFGRHPKDKKKMTRGSITPHGVEILGLKIPKKVLMVQETELQTIVQE